MSVPIHNLYDFIHQTLKRRFNLAYFYPYGQKQFANLVNQQGNYFPDSLYEVKDLVMYEDLDPWLRVSEHSIACKIFPSNLLIRGLQNDWNPWIVCNDQEPLDFDYYENENNYRSHVEHVKSFNRTPAELARTHNFRWLHSPSTQKKWIVLHSELNSKEVHKYNNSGSFTCAYYWSHAFIARDWYRFAEYDITLQPGRYFRKPFLIYNRESTGTRTYRDTVIEKLHANNLIESCQIGSFLDHASVTSASSAEYDCYDINSSLFQVVLETVYDERIHLTEKTLRALACGIPFLLLCGAGSLQTLRNYGFKTFEPYINEAYDQEPDSQKRMDMVVSEMQRINANPVAIFEKCKHIVEHNKKHFFSNKFFNILCAELKQNVAKAEAITGNEIDWQFIIKSRMQRKSAQPGHYKKRTSTLPINSEIISLCWHLRKGGTVDNYEPPWKNS
jgi:hypothetical protein